MRTVTFARALRQPFVSSDDNRTAGLLLRVLKDSSFSVKREAAKALGKLNVNTFDDEVISVGSGAFESLITVRCSTNSVTSCASLPQERRTSLLGAQFTRSLRTSQDKNSKGFRLLRNKRSRCSNNSGHLMLTRQKKK